MRTLFKEVEIQIKLYFRDKQLLFWNMAFPIFMMFIFGSVFWGKRPSYIEFILPTLIAITSMSTAFISIGVVVTGLKQSKLLRRIKLTPLPKWIFFTGQMVSRYIIVLLQTLLIIATGVLVFKVEMKGSIFASLIVITIGIIAFISMGFCIPGFVKKTETAGVIANLLFFPMLFLSGGWFPLEAAPQFIQYFARILPAAYFIHAVREVLMNGTCLTGVIKDVWILLGWLIAGSIISVKFFRWE